MIKFPRRMLEFYFSKGFGILERNSNHLKKTPNLSKQIIQAEEAHDSEYVMTCNITVFSISKTLKKL